MNSDSLFWQLREKPEYRRYLYRFGYLITDCKISDSLGILENWSHTRVRGWDFYIHPDQRLYLFETRHSVWFLIGHCYDPFAMEHREDVILSRLAQSEDYHAALADLTGVFVTGCLTEGAITVYTDAAGMLMANYGVVNGHVCITSHAHLAGTLLGLRQSDYVRRLTAYRFYHLFGFFLPGDLTPYAELRRLVPNHRLVIREGQCDIKRFYPTEDWSRLCKAHTLEERADRAAQILKNTMALIPEKWEKPAITLTGGCDSKTTLACANGNYDRYRYFSYSSQEAEELDARGAHVICGALGLPHAIHPIPDEMPDAELVREIIAANMGGIGWLPLREVRKRMYLANMADVDVEVKSWVSEVARAYFHKRFAKKMFPDHPTARYLTTLYKVFFHDRKLVRETDAIFEEYLGRYLSGGLHGWDWIDLLFWEFRVGGWNGLVITSEHRYAFDITIPYNNRRLLELMLAVPLEERINDTLYAMIRDRANPAVDAAGVAITNLKHTSNRAKLERLYLAVHTRLPF